ncbi:MAG: hypothetical protein ACT4ON_00965 [Bacteroidota bacterium]
MAAGDKYYPQLTDIINKNAIPNNLGFVNDILDNALEGMFYTDLHIEKSPYGDAAFYHLNLVSFRKIGFEVPGTNGLEFLINPDLSDTNITSVPISLSYKWKILRYIKAARVAGGFSTDPIFYFNLFLEIIQVSPEEFFKEVAGALVGGTDPIEEFVTVYNNTNTSSTTLVIRDGLSDDEKVEYIIDFVEADSKDLYSFVFDNFILDNSLEESLKRIETLFKKWLGEIGLDEIKELFIPQVNVSIDNISAGIRFPLSWMKQVNPDNTPKLDSNGNFIPALLRFDLGSVSYGTKSGFEFTSESDFNFTRAEILDSGFILELEEMKLDLSRTKNIPEAIADGRPDDFIGVYIKKGVVGFPAFWQHDEDASTGELRVTNLLAGTGGLSGTIGLAAVTAGNPSPLISVKFGDFQVSLDAFSLTFHQNSIVASDIAGTLKIAGFKDASNQDAEIRIRIHIGKNGEFSIVAQENEGIVLRIPQVLDFTVKELAVGKKDGHYFLGVSGNLGFTVAGVGSALPKDIEIKKLVIWDTGKIELQGGTITLPKPISLKLGPANLSITAIGFGSDERFKGGELRKYNYFEFAGGLSVKPGGVEARGDGIKFYYSVDGKAFDFFIRIESIKIDLIIPGSATEKDATLLIKGYLSMKQAPPPDEGADEYIGGVAFSMPKSGLGGSVAMRMIPKVPSFLVDVEIDLPSPIIIFSGVGIYGFRGLFGQKYLASRSASALAAAGLKPDGEWYQYYKLKVAPEYKEGVQVSKFIRKQGFSIGLGASIATAGDGGKTFSSKVFFMVSLPGLFLLQGQAAILRARIKITDTTDPPFSLLLVITKESLTADFGVNYKIPEEDGKILKLNALMEMGFFFKTPNAWYLNVGRDLPETKRVTGRILDLFDVYAYLMFSGTGIKSGAGASFAQSYSAGPLKADLRVYLDIAGKINFKPVQIGASICFGGDLLLSIFKFKFQLTASLTLAGEVPHPFFISGTLKACVKVLKKDRCISIQFTWTFDKDPNRSKIPLFAPDKAIKARNMLTQETYPLLPAAAFPGSVTIDLDDDEYTVVVNGTPYALDNFTVPLDSYIDMEFLKPIKGLAGGPGIAGIGGAATPVNNSDSIPLKKGKLEQIRHGFTLDSLIIKHWDPTSSSWQSFDIYEALSPLSIPGVNVKKPDNPKYGYWQFDTATSKINKLSIMATSPLEYMRAASKLIPTEYLGVTSTDLFCAPEPRKKICVDFNDVLGTTFTEDALSAQDDLMFRIIGADGSIQEVVNPFGFDNALVLEPGSSMEIYFHDSMALVELTMLMRTEGMTISYYAQTFGPETDSNFIPIKGYRLVKKETPSISSLVEPLVYEDEENPIDKIVIEAGICANDPVSCRMSGESGDLEMLFNTLAQTGKLTNTAPPGIGGAVNLKEEPYASTYNPRLASYKLTNTKHFYYTDNNPAGSDTLHMVIGAPDEASCVITLTTSNNETILFSQIMSFFNMRPDPEFYVSGINYRFLVDVAVLDQTYTLKGFSTCYPMAICHGGSLDHKREVCVEVKKLIEKLEERIIVLTREKIVSEQICQVHSQGDCSSIGNLHCEIATRIEFEIITITEQIVTLTEYTETQCTLVDDGGGVTNPCAAYLFKVCRMTKDNFDYNKKLPTATDVAVDTSAMLDALSGSITPTLRPATAYYIELITSDTIQGSPNRDTYRYLFRTAGPVGHFHEKRPEYKKLLPTPTKPQGTEDQFRLKFLKDYIDFDKSYPNANGNVINAKPLFYNCPKLLLFFITPQVYTMYNNFDAYHGLPAVTSKLEAIIKDPAEPNGEPVDPDEPDGPFLPVEPITGDIAWVINDDGIMTQDVQTLNNLMNGPKCTPVSPITKPKGANIEVDLCGKLKPLKMYNALFNAVYNGKSNGVHTYSFQTSQYAEFKEQVESYLIKDSNGIVKKNAFFDIDKEFNPGALNPSTGIVLSRQIIDGDETDTTPLRDFAQPFDRLIDKSFELTAINPAVTTEFNMLVDTSTGNSTSGNVLGILISNPEPFNDPKLKAEDLEKTIHVVTDITGNTVDEDYAIIISKDVRKAFITHKGLSGSTDLNITAQQLFIRFRYLEFNGKEYVLNTPAINQVIVPVDVKAPLTNLIPADCGKTNVGLDETLSATIVTGAIGYEFKIEHAASSFSATYTRSNADGKLPLVEIEGLMYNKTYSISVRPIIAGRLTKFGSVCQVSTKVLSFVIVQPANIMQGESGLVRVEVQDINGNIIYEFQDDVTLVAEAGSNVVVADSGLVDIVNGIGTISITSDYVETAELSLVDSENTGLVVSSTQDVTFTVAPATQLVIEDPADTVQGMEATVTVHARNSFPNEDIDTNFNGTVKLNLTGSAIAADLGIVTIVNGTGTIQVTDNVTETVTLTLEDVGNTGLDVSSTQDIVFTLAAATQFVIADPSDSIQGVAVTVTVTARNEFGYIDINYNEDVTLVASGNATGEGLVNIVNGTGTLQINDTTNETVQLSLLDSEDTELDVSSTQEVVFGIAPATKFVIIDPADSVQGTAVTVTVQAQNQFGTVVSNYQNDVTLVASGNATGE